MKPQFRMPVNEAREIRFDLPGYRIETLTPADATLAQPLFEACADYALMESGAIPSADAADNEFRATPPGRTAADKFIFGLTEEGSRRLVAIIIADCGWPDAKSWWIALMLVHPALRGMGVAVLFANAVLSWIERHQAEGVELAVFGENRRAERFWLKLKFRYVRSTEPRAIGKKTHVLHIMRRDASR